MPSISFQPQLRELRDVLGTDFYTIPRFQRPYSWTQENLEDFMTDVISDNDEGYFIGPMVTYRIGKRASAIVDGQQRTTTVTIILCVLRDLFLEVGEHRLADAIRRYIEREDDDSVSHFVLRSDAAGDFLKSQIQVSPPRHVQKPVSDEQRVLKKAFDEISSNLRKHIANFDYEATDGETSQASKELRRIRDKILSLQTIWIQLDNEDDAYIIFETLNSRGKDLEVVDLLKNHLLARVKSENGDLDTARIGWNSMREVLDQAGGVNSNKFILHWWLSKGEYTAERKLFKLLRRKLPSVPAKATILELANDARTYARIASPVTAKWLHHERELGDSLQALEIFGVKQPRPLLLAVLRSYEQKTIPYKTARRAVAAVEAFHYVSTAVVGVSSTGGISQMYASHARDLSAASGPNDASLVIDKLIKRLQLSKSARDVFISEFGRQLRYSEKDSSNKRLVQYTLRKVHLHERPHAPLDVSQCNIEHLHPQSTGDDWAAQIGNLLFVSAKLNSALGAGSFPAKKAALSGERDLYDIDDILAADSWNESAARARAERLAAIAYDGVWKL